MIFVFDSAVVALYSPPSLLPLLGIMAAFYNAVCGGGDGLEILSCRFCLYSRAVLLPVQTALRLGEIRRPTYSGYMVEKTHTPKIGFKFGPDQFRINSGYMCFFNHITTVRGSTNSAQPHARELLFVCNWCL